MTTGSEVPYFFSYNGTSNVNELLIPRLKYVGYTDLGMEEQRLIQGEVDISRRLSDDLYGLDRRDFADRYSLLISLLPSSGFRLLFNLASPNVQKYETRRGIAYAINKADIYILSVTRVAKDSPIPSYYTRYYSDEWKINYDPYSAELLLPGPKTTPGDPIVTDIPPTLTNSSTSPIETPETTMVPFFISGSTLTLIVLVFSKRRDKST